MGRLINSLSEKERKNIIIIFIGDNGTPTRVTQAYGFRRSKGTIYQGGVNVPMVISGKGVSRMHDTEDALINATDLFATIADIAGTGTTEIHDSKSFKPLLKATKVNSRNYIYTENADFSIRNTTYKYISFNDGIEALYNLKEDPLEKTNLLNNKEISSLSNTEKDIKNNLINKAQEIRK